MEDILEELVGEIWDEHDDIVKHITKISDNKFSVLCSMDFEEFCEFFQIEIETEMNSVGGFVMEQLGKVPEINDTFSYENLDVLVTETDEKRASLITVTKNEIEIEEN